jgi:hypothetical protein
MLVKSISTAPRRCPLRGDSFSGPTAILEGMRRAENRLDVRMGMGNAMQALVAVWRHC